MSPLPRRKEFLQFVALVIGVVRAAAAAELLPDNNPDAVRPIPKPGIEVPQADREELEAGLAKLGAMLDTLRPPGKYGDWVAKRRLDRLPVPELALLQSWDNYADVAIFHRAVRIALEDQEFFEPKEIEAARRLLQIGLERAEQLQASELPWIAPWRSQTGLVVRGYISSIDHTPQPYGLVIPESYDVDDTQRRHRLDLWFHGRGETLSEVNFLTQRLAGRGPIAPPDTIVLHPYGRFCNANKFAGEIDAFEALQAASRAYRVADQLIAVRGFSMGGAACWHFAVHHPTLWFAANPGAGFAETPRYLAALKQETLHPTWWEEKLWRWYDCPGYVTNLKNSPVVAYSGENDPQKQAADLMAAACDQAGMTLLHLIGPMTGHRIHPETAKEIEARMSEWATQAERRANQPDTHFEFTTYSLVYPNEGVVIIDGMKEQWEQASIVVDREDQGDIRVQTENVTALTVTAGKNVIIDGQPLRPAKSDESPQDFVLKDGTWRHAPLEYFDEPRPLRKRRGLCGPIDHAFMSSFIFVKPTGRCAHPAVQNWVDAEMNRAITQWRRQFRGDPRVKRDADITVEDLASANLVLWGDRSSNSVLARIADQLPISWNDSQITVGDQAFSAADHALIAIYPNPLNDKHFQNYVVLNSGFTFREYDYLTNARQTPKLPDWAVVDLRTPPNSRWPGKIVAADFFDEEWQLKPLRTP